MDTPLSELFVVRSCNLMTYFHLQLKVQANRALKENLRESGRDLLRAKLKLDVQKNCLKRSSRSSPRQFQLKICLEQ